MQEYTFEVNLQVKLLAFNASDAEDAIRESLGDLGCGAEVTKMKLDLVPDES